MGGIFKRVFYFYYDLIIFITIIIRKKIQKAVNWDSPNSPHSFMDNIKLYTKKNKFSPKKSKTHQRL